MDPTILAILGIVVMLGMIALGVPIAFSMAVTGIGGYWILVGLKQALTQIYINSVDKGADIIFIALPLFILMGQLVYHSKLAVDLYDCVQKWFGRMPGGLAITSVAGCAAFGAVTGSSVAAVATIAPMAMPEMRRHNYDPRLATGAIASAGTLAMLIPPSVILVAYGVWTETSIGHLFIAGIIPGLVLAAMFSIYIAGRCIINPEMGPVGPHYSWYDRITSLVKLLPIFIIFVVVLGGIYIGAFTPTEASGIGVTGVFLTALVMGRFTFKTAQQALMDAARTSAMIFAIIIGGYLVARFLAVTGLTEDLVRVVAGMELGRVLFLLLLIALYLVLGAMLDVFGMLVLTIPFVLPLVTALGIDLIWFGIFVVIMAELALITPPVGANVFVMRRVAPDVPMGDIFRGVFPFVLGELVVLALLIAFPELALWLPSKMG